MNKLTIKYVDVNTITPYSQNAKVHTPKQLEQIKKSIQTFGYINPVILDKTNTLVAGHGRYLAMLDLGYTSIPCIYATHLSKSRIRAYRIVDNRIAENSGWDESLLSVELKDLQDIDVAFDFTMLGFETAEIDTLLNVTSDNADETQDQDLPERPQQPVTCLGDIYQVGPHRIGCGDARDPEFIGKVTDQVAISLGVTDPPYNVPIAGHARGLGKHQHANFVMASGEMSSLEYIQFVNTCLSNFSNVACEGSLHYVFCDWRHLNELFQATDEVYTELINMCVWNKINGGMGSFYRSQHELVCVFKKGKKPHINNIELGKHGRYRTNVWNHPGLSSFTKDRDAELALHPTPKPIALIKDIILDASHRGDMVLDGFLGAGATLMACEQVHRKCIGIELDPKYVDVTLQRWMQYTGEEPVHIESGLKFTELSAQRKREQEVA